MRKLFSEVPLAEVHIKLDKQKLRGLSEREIMVLQACFKFPRKLVEMLRFTQDDK